MPRPRVRFLLPCCSRTAVTVVEEERTNLAVTLQAMAPTLDTARAVSLHDHCDRLTLDGVLCWQQAGIR